jgi:hypothetical protein
MLTCECAIQLLIYSQSAVYHYLQANGFKSAADALSSQTEISNDPKYHELLEKKWISVVRLQKRVYLEFIM